jgi:signal transduction histidine kinase
MDRPVKIPDTRIAELIELGLSGAMLIHELRQPIFSIRAMAQLAIAKGTCDAAVLHDILTQVATMDEYVEHFSQTGASDFQKFCAVECAQRGLRLLADRAKSQGVSFLSEFTKEEAGLYGRPNALFQVVTNLLSNAVNALKGVDDAVVLLSVAVTADNLVKITVDDNGAGVPEDLRDSLFDPFVTSRAGAGGTGLGLYLTKQLVEGLTGTVAVSTSDSGGARFEVCIPRRAS